ncbi:MAG: hypothetical protein H2057_04010 [Alphaproteobacteria bacterium]|nr:hypothetical protein [Alphaproteobacteria bacterium]
MNHFLLTMILTGLFLFSYMPLLASDNEFPLDTFGQKVTLAPVFQTPSSLTPILKRDVTPSVTPSVIQPQTPPSLDDYVDVPLDDEYDKTTPVKKSFSLSDPSTWSLSSLF